VAVAEEIGAHQARRMSMAPPHSPTAVTFPVSSSSPQPHSQHSESGTDSVDLSSEIHRLVVWLLEDNIEKLQQIQLLAAKVDEMTWLNNVMGEKIRTFSEQLIQKKTQTKSRRRKTGIFGQNPTE
jgi:hypothetical protein